MMHYWSKLSDWEAKICETQSRHIICPIILFYFRIIFLLESAGYFPVVKENAHAENWKSVGKENEEESQNKEQKWKWTLKSVHPI